MTKPLLRNLIILGLAITLVTATRIAQFRSTAQQAPQVQNPYLVFDTVDDITEAYHESVNEFFNEKIARLVELGLDGKEAALKLATQPPPILNGKRETCDGPPIEGVKGVRVHGLSTYCLSETLVIQYFRFREAMLVQKKQLKFQAAQRYQTVKGKSIGASNPAADFENQPILSSHDVTHGSKTLQDYGEAINQADRELELGRVALDQGLATYNELQMALPLHMKYKQVITRLEGYRDSLASVRNKVALYPVTFLDVTTPACQ